jgi:hypothetical protein
VLVEALVRTMRVEVVGVLAEHLPRVLFVVEQQPVGALGADAAHERFRVAVRAGRLRWDFDDLYALGTEYGVEGGGELRVAVSDREPEGPDAAGQVGEQGAGLLNGPGTGRVRGDTQDVHPPGRLKGSSSGPCL